MQGKVSLLGLSFLYHIASIFREDHYGKYRLRNLHKDVHALYFTNFYGPRQANLVLIAYASSEGSGEPSHPRSLARTSAARSYKH